MNIKEFETNREEAIEKIELKTDYIPYVEKVAICKEIAEATSHKEVEGSRIFSADSTTRHLFYIVKLVEVYTNIEIENNNIVLAYDTLNHARILDVLFGNEDGNVSSIIPYGELIEFEDIMRMILDDIYQNEYSMSAIFMNLKDSLGMVGNVFMQSLIEAANNIEDNDFE